MTLLQVRRYQGRGRDDLDLPAQRSELNDHLLGETVAEVRPSEMAEGTERQDDKADAWRERSLLSGTDESIPATRDRLHKRRSLGIVAEGGAQPLDCRVEAVLEVDEDALRPEPALQFVPCHDMSRPFEEHAENLERLRLQADAGRTVSQFSGLQIELERPNPYWSHLPTASADSM
jgi:hypothetical protein